MANPEHLKILLQGVDTWNQWRLENPNISVDLRGEVLSRLDLYPRRRQPANLSRVDFEQALLIQANLKHANLSHANLTSANFGDANLSYANLTKAILRGTYLDGANFYGANFNSTDFTSAILGATVFGSTNLASVIGLDTCIHQFPSTLDHRTQSAGKIPEAFLRGCGLSDWQIENAKLFQPDLSNEEITNILYRVHDLRAHQAIQISPLFISYSHADSPFVDMIEVYLNEKGIRFWRDIHHATAGRLERQIDHAIRLNPTVLLVLSAQSVKSDWVEHEARLARKLEQEIGSDVLCPIALDDSWKTCKWPERLREQIMEYNILDFSNWRDADYLQRMFTRLIEGLNLFYKVES